MRNHIGIIVHVFSHDNAGNLLSDVQGGVTTTYAYNNANRMASFTKGSTTTGTYIYNARGQLVIRNVTNSSNNGITVYFYDQQGHVIAEYNGSNGNLIREYVWLGDMPLAVIDPGSTTYYVHADHLNRPVAMTNAAKTFVANYVWLPYGGLHSYTGTAEVDLRFPGQLMQAESGLYYNWNRQYDPTTGRYTQADPLGLVDGSSRYAYVGNDPLQAVDPTGLVLTGNFSYACKVLGLDPNEASEELHTLKYMLDLRGDDNCLFDTDTGDVFFNGECIGNILDR